MTLPTAAEATGRLAERVARAWPAVMHRLGERREALEAAVAQRAAGHGLVEAVDAARYLNLCLAFGPGFEDKTENEWALALLADERLRPPVKLHQLVQRALRELHRRPADAQTLRNTDHAVLDLYDAERQRKRADAEPSPRTACDLDAAELRLLDTGWRQEYQRAAGAWSRVAVTGPAPLRIGTGHPAPDIVYVLTGMQGESDAARLQVRQVSHGHCGLGLHPAVQWIDSSGLHVWRDHEARSAAWTLAVAPPQTLTPPRLLAETAPEVSLLALPSCALRDEGVPMGALQMQVWAYAAWQWLWLLERSAPLGCELPDGRSAPPAAQPTRIRCERDGLQQSTDSWQQAFDSGLREALVQGLQRLLKAWQPHVQEASLRAEFGLFDGKAALTWGWREGPRGLASPPVQRVVADLDLAARGELQLAGMVEFAGAKARLRVRFDGEARLQTPIERLHADAPLIEAMQAASLRWRWPVHIDYDPVADDNGIVFSEVGPCSGALTGSLGLRPSPTAGGAWEWFATLAIEPVSTRVVVHDPVLGRSESHMALLTSVSLLDWSLL